MENNSMISLLYIQQYCVSIIPVGTWVHGDNVCVCVHECTHGDSCHCGSKLRKQA